MEIADTDAQDFRDDLKREEAVLKRLLGEVGLHGVLRHPEAHGDLLVDEPFAEQRQDLPLPRRQRAAATVPSVTLEQRRREPGRHGGQASRGPANGGTDLRRGRVRRQDGTRPGPQRPRGRRAVQLVQQNDKRRRIVLRTALEAEWQGQLSLGSGTEQDDIRTALIVDKH